MNHPVITIHTPQVKESGYQTSIHSKPSYIQGVFESEYFRGSGYIEQLKIEILIQNIILTHCAINVYAKNLADSWHLEKPMLQCKGKKKFPSGPASYFGIVSDEYRVTVQCMFLNS